MPFILFDEHLGTCYPVGEARLGGNGATVRDLIRARVELELERQAGRLSPPSPAETALNGTKALPSPVSMFLDRLSSRRDLEALVRHAEAGFEQGRYFLLLNDRQAEALDEAVDLAGTSEATFLMITPLQGG